MRSLNASSNQPFSNCLTDNDLKYSATVWGAIRTVLTALSDRQKCKQPILSTDVKLTTITTTEDRLKLMYEENSKVAQVFWEWRDKTLTRFSVSVGSAFLLARWMFKNQEPGFKEWIFLPFLLCMAYAVLCGRMDRVNTWVLENCYEIGREIERKLTPNAPGVFTAISSNYHQKGNYSRLLWWFFHSFALIFLFFAAAFFWIFTL